MSAKNFIFRILPFLAFVFFVCIFTVVWLLLNNSLVKDQQQSLIDQKQKIVATISEKIKTYSDAIYSVRGFFNSSVSVERNEWKKYINSINLFERHLGISSLNYVQRVKAAELDNFIKEVRMDTSTNGIGYPDFKLNPESKKDEYYIGKYVEPEAGRSQVMGFDFSSESNRKAALETARDNNLPIASNVVNLVTTNKPGTSIILPVYKNNSPIATIKDRRENLVGFIMATLRIDDFYNSVIADSGIATSSLVFVVFEVEEDGTNKSVFVYNPNNIDLTGHYFTDINADVGGKIWILRFYNYQAGLLSPENKMLSYSFLFGGIVISFFAGLTIYFLASSRRRALKLADEMVAKALEDKKRYEVLFQSSGDSIITIEPPNWNFTSANPAAVKMFNLNKIKDVHTLNLWKLSPDKQPDGSFSIEKIKELINRTMDKGSVSFEWVCKRYRGEDFPVVILLDKVFYGGKDFVQVTIRDITTQKKNEEIEKARVKEIEKMNELMVGRELKMSELKKEIKQLKNKKK